MFASLWGNIFMFFLYNYFTVIDKEARELSLLDLKSKKLSEVCSSGVRSIEDSSVQCCVQGAAWLS